MRGLLFTSIVLMKVAVLFAAEPAQSSMPQEVYVWQRDWTPQVKKAVSDHAANFGGVTVLSAEVSWVKNEPRLKRVHIDYASLLAAGRPVGLALRVGPFSGAFSSDDKTALWLSDLAVSLLAEAKTHGLAPAELQIDFDCADSKLEGYRLWINAIRKRIAPTPLTLTALPSWLKQSYFKTLAASADGFILQVHSLERPTSRDSTFQLCRPDAARQAVLLAGKLGVPFRVALPTYGYVMAFDVTGRCIGVSAEGPAIDWPEGVQLREVRADPQTIADLVATWKTNRPSSFKGIIWYRLPVSGEHLNWRWGTLDTVMSGQLPTSNLQITARRTKSALIDIDLSNLGPVEQFRPIRVRMRWPQSARFVAADGLNGFVVTHLGTNSLEFETAKLGIGPGEHRNFGWVRLNQDSEVQCEILSN